MTAPNHPTRSVPGDDKNITAIVASDSAHSAVPLTGTDRYDLGDEIARGGMGVVYRATDAALDREVAVKVLHEKYAPTSAAARRFADEARIAGQLQHPGIPPIHDLGTLPDGRPFLVMKLIKGQTLDELLKGRSDVATDRGRFVAVFEQVCQAIAYAHAHKVIHRDLKPANVMVGNYGEVQVMDWGLAKVLDNRPVEADDPEETSNATEVRSIRDTDGSFTQAGSVLGTPAFMPPEQAVGAITQVDERSDVFGLGAVLAVILTGKPPFAADHAETTRIQAAQGSVEDCFARLDACGAEPDLVELCKKCLSPKPANRPSDGGMVARAVAELRHAADERARRAELDKVRVEGEKAAAEVRTAEQQKRRKVQAALGIAFTALVVLVGSFAWWVQDQRRTRRDQAEREVNEAIGTAEARYAQARGADRDLALWAEARAAALQAQERAADAAPDVRERVGKLLAEIEQIEKNRRLVASLLDIQASMGDVVNADSSQDFVGADVRYERAFREYGGDLGQLSAEQGAELLRNLGGRSNVELAAAVDDWAYVRFWLTRRRTKSQKAERHIETDRLIRVTQLLDPDPLRNRIREAIVARDGSALARLTEEIDPATQPTQTVNLVSVWQAQLRWFAGGVANDEAIQFLRKSQLHHPADFQINHNLAFLLIWNRRHAEALPYSLAAIAVRPKSAAAWLDYAKALRGVKRDDEAIAAHRRVVELSPRAWIFLIDAGEILERQDKIDEAVTEYRKAAMIVGEHYLGDNTQFFNRGMTKWSKYGLVDEVTTSIRKAIRRDPKNSVAHENLGRLFVKLGKPDDARVEFEEAFAIRKALVEQFPDKLGYRRDLANTLWALNREVEAIQHLATAWEHDPSNTSLLLEVAALQSWFGLDKDHAATCAKAIAFAKDTTDPTTADRTAKVCCLRGSADPAQFDAALVLARQSVNLGKGNAYFPYFQLVRGMAEYRTGQFAEADETLKLLAEPDKSNSHVSLTSAFYRAITLFRLGKKPEARQLADAAAAKMKPLPADEKTPLAGDASHDDLIVWLAFREANSLLKLELKSR